MAEHTDIYRSQADKYEALVSREDYQGNILPAIQKIVNPAGKDVVEFGAGTGRLTCLLTPLVKRIHAYDQSDHMLAVARQRLAVFPTSNWKTGVADHRSLPEQDGSADIIIAGWSICYLVVDHPQTWQTETQKVFNEMKRLLRPGGTIMIIETLGTGFETPTPPTHLMDYYTWLSRQGFSKKTIRTDYRFNSMETAKPLVEFFFGEEMTTKLTKSTQDVLLAECTGIWSLRLKDHNF